MSTPSAIAGCIYEGMRIVLCLLVLWLREACFLAFSGMSKTKLSAWKRDVLNATVLGNEAKGVVAAGLSSPGSFSEPLVGEVGGERVGNPWPTQPTGATVPLFCRPRNRIVGADAQQLSAI